jgi:hypothetical protein
MPVWMLGSKLQREISCTPRLLITGFSRCPLTAADLPFIQLDCPSKDYAFDNTRLIALVDLYIHPDGPRPDPGISRSSSDEGRT